VRDSRIIIARFPGTASDGTRVRKGAEILWDPRSRRVVTADPGRIAEWRSNQTADAVDLAYEDSCARACGLDSLSPFRD
jgi:hypothetical protein